MPDLEVTKTDTHHKTVRHWADKEIKEIHKAQGKSWRSVHPDSLESLKPTTRTFRRNYEKIFGHK